MTAMVHRLKGEPEQLLRAIERLIAMNPDHADALYWTAWSYMSMGRPERGVGILERVVERHPDQYMASSHLASCYLMLGRKADAAQALTRARDRMVEVLRRHPDLVHARSALSGILVQLGEREAGLREIARALQMAPEDGRIRYNAACTYAQAGLPEEAIAQLKEGTRNIPSYLMDWPRHDPDLASVREHPEFIRLFGRSGDA